MENLYICKTIALIIYGEAFVLFDQFIPNHPILAVLCFVVVVIAGIVVFAC